MSDSSIVYQEGEVEVDALASRKPSATVESEDCAALMSEWSLSISIIALAQRVGPSRKVAQSDVESCS